MTSKKEDLPFSVQLFGSDPDCMAEAAKIVQSLKVADIIDINFGCSVKKVIKQGAGAALLKEPELSRKILTSIRNSVDLPLTIKIRSGWDHSGNQAFEIAKIAQDAGENAIVKHPRTASQGFKGKANWELIKKLKLLVSIPVIGNGDINSVEDAVKMVELTGCDAVMAGRAAAANPFILSKIDDFFKTGTYKPPSTDEIFKAMQSLIKMYVTHFGEQAACRKLRGRLAWFVKGLPGSSALRKNLSQINSKAHALTMIKEFQKHLT